MRTILKLSCLLFFVLSANSVKAQDEIQRVRIDFLNPEGYTRHLLLGFTPNNVATDDFDYGYDALNPDDFPDDLNWMIGEDRCVIQGVGAFDTSKYYPLGMFLSNDGEVSVSLANLENFEEEINVYLYDLVSDTYSLLNATTFDKDLVAGTYLNRFYLTFSTGAHLDIISANLLSNGEVELNDLKIRYSGANETIEVNGLKASENILFTLYSLEGKTITEKRISESNSTLSTSQLSSGIYIVKVDASTFSQTQKICITN